MLLKYMSQKRILVLLLTLLVIAAMRLYFVETFAVRLPFWDQWDAEGDLLLRPWIEGRFQTEILWQTHNEHRIFPTRLLSLLIFSITGVWDNLIEARVNIAVAVCIPLILLGFLMRQGALTALRWLTLIVVVAQFGLPFSYENLLVGFQSQFYFLIIFTFLALILAALYPDSPAAMGGVLALGVLAVLTMASGLLTPLATMGVYVLHAAMRRKISLRHGVMLVILVTTAVAGYLIIPQIEANRVFRAQNLSDLVNALQYILAWPVEGASWPAAVALWTPALVVVPWLLRSRRLAAADLFMAGCVMWSLAQGVAIAYGRGQNLDGMASRYSELLTPGLIGNAWFAVRFAEQWGRDRRVWAGGLFFVVFIMAHITRYREDLLYTRRAYGLSLKQEQNVRRYLQTNDPGALDQPQFEIPYPQAERLQLLLDTPTIRRILPVEYTHAEAR